MDANGAKAGRPVKSTQLDLDQGGARRRRSGWRRLDGAQPMPLAQVLFLAGVVVLYTVFAVTLFSVHVYVNVSPRKQAAPARRAVQDQSASPSAV